MLGRGRSAKLHRLWASVLVLLLSSAILQYSYAAASFDEGIQELAQKLAPEARKLSQKRLAVVDFTDLQGRITVLGRYIAEELSAALVIGGGGLRVVDRQHLARIIQEQKLSIYGVTDPQFAKRLGRLAGADALVVGTATDLGDSVRITAKLLGTDTGDIVAAAQTNVPRAGTVERLIAQGIMQGFGGSPATPSTSPRPQRTSPQPSRVVAPGQTASRRVTSLAELPTVLGGPPRFQTVTLFGQVYEQALSYWNYGQTMRFVYNLNRQYGRFEALVGVADNQHPQYWAVAKVLGDNQVLFESPQLRSGEPPVKISVSAKGVLRLELITIFAPYSLEIVWANPKLIKE